MSIPPVGSNDSPFFLAGGLPEEKEADYLLKKIANELVSWTDPHHPEQIEKDFSKDFQSLKDFIKNAKLSSSDKKLLTKISDQIDNLDRPFGTRDVVNIIDQMREFPGFSYP
jgi:hypothetical protein